MNQIDKNKYLKPYIGVHLIECDNGYIVWRLGTGENVELLHLRTFSPGKGTGRALLNAMLNKLRENPPYCTVFGFTRTVNKISQEFYKALGFELTEVKGVYADGTAILFSQTFDRLLERNNDSTLYE